MVTFKKGNIFNSSAQVITNTINIVGVMGAGLALEYKNRYPQMFADYKKRCQLGEIKPGQPYLWEDEHSQILNFPTKRHWKDSSRIEDIEDGLQYLANNYQQLEIQSLALPPLGCGLGGLEWEIVRPLIEKYLGHIPDLEVFVYEPDAVQSARQTRSNEKISSSNSKSDIAAQH